MKSRSYKITKSIAIATVAIVAAMISFQVRELAAVLLIFSLVFGTVGAAVLVLILIQEMALWGVSGIEARVARVRAQRSHVSARAHTFAEAHLPTR
jgi:hypothetical protein